LPFGMYTNCRGGGTLSFSASSDGHVALPAKMGDSCSTSCGCPGQQLKLAMRVSLNIKRLWSAIRWKMLIIFGFFSVISMGLVACFSIALLNVVIRRENAYLVEERIKALVDNDRRLAAALVDQVGGCNLTPSKPPAVVEHPRGPWLGAQVTVTVLPKGTSPGGRSSWLNADSFAGVIRDHDALEIRSFHTTERDGCSVRVMLRRPLTPDYLGDLSRQAGLPVSDAIPVMLQPYRSEEGVRGEVEANFLPGSRRPVPVVVVAHDWQTGLPENWVVCQVGPSYARTIDDLSHMGLRTASWVAPFGGIALLLILAYGCGLFFSVRLSQHIVTAIDSLSDAAHQVGKGDFAVRVVVPQQDQLGILASSFNEMTRELEGLREQEKQKAILEWEIGLAHEVQQYLYPRCPCGLPTAQVSGLATPARVVSGDLYDFFPFSSAEIGLLCADISGKGMSAALMMAHLQALVHGRLLASDEMRRPAPSGLVAALNEEFRGRFGDSRYATMFYGEFDSHSKILRYVNAGHCPPILISKEGEPKKLSAADLPVGLFPEITYQELRVTLPKGSAVIVYTDGLTDALNSQGEAFGEGRLMDVCKSLPRGVTAETICQLLSGKVSEWSAGVDQLDDTTILVLTVD
jgi:serine phosphatase RsbU (regulator of sigma subunit)